MRPIAWRVTCAICGDFRIVRGGDWVNVHLDMRIHVRETHEEAKVDLFGTPVRSGYGWTDDYVAVLPLYNEADIKRFGQPTEAVLKTARLGGK